MLTIGSIFDERYQIDSFLGAGGFGSVYKATELALNRTVAIKLLHAWDEHEVRPDSLARFQREAQALCQLEYQNILKVYRLGLDEHTPFLVLEYFPGISLRQLIVEKAPLNYRFACNIALKIAEALKYSHAAGVIHRDLKPENVLLVPDFDKDTAELKIIDFGLCKPEIVPTAGASTLTGTGELLGSPDYMSPEQALGKKVDKKTDLYSFALMFFEMITGEKPFKAASIAELLMQRLSVKVPRILDLNPRCQFPASIDALIQSCAAINVDDRPDSFDEVVEELQEAIKTVPLASYSAGAGAAKSGRQVLWKNASLGILLLLIVSLGSFFGLTIFKSATVIKPEGLRRSLANKIESSIRNGKLEEARSELKNFMTATKLDAWTSIQRADFYYEMFHLFSAADDQTTSKQMVLGYLKARFAPPTNPAYLDEQSEKQVSEIYAWIFNPQTHLDRKFWASLYADLCRLDFRDLHSRVAIYIEEIVTEALINGRANPQAEQRYYYLKELSSLIMAADLHDCEDLYKRYCKRALAACHFPGVYRFEARILGLMVNHELKRKNLELAEEYMKKSNAIQERLRSNEDQLELKTSYQARLYETEIELCNAKAAKFREQGREAEAKQEERKAKKLHQTSTAMLHDVQEEEDALHATFDPMYMEDKSAKN